MRKTVLKGFGLPPLTLYVTSSADEVAKFFRKIGMTYVTPGEGINACVYRLKKSFDFLIYLHPDAPKDSLVSTAAHEAVHVKQDYLADLGEATDTIEFEAYLVGAVAELLYQAFMAELRAP